MTKTTEETDDNENYSRYLKAFGFMTAFTAVVCIIIVASCILFKTAKAATAAATAGVSVPAYLAAVYAIIGGTPTDTGWVAFLTGLVLFGWYVTTSMFLLTTRPMLDLFQSTPIMEKVKIYAVYPILAIIGLVLLLGVVMFIPWFPVHMFSDVHKRYDNEAEMYRDSTIYRIAQKLQIEDAYKALMKNFQNVVRFASFVGLGGIILAAVSLIVAVSVFVATNQTGGIVGILKGVLLVVAILIAVAAVLSGYDSIKQTERSYAISKNTSITVLILKILKYIPCFILDVVNDIKREFNLTTKPVWILMGLECFVIGLYFLSPLLMQATVFKNSKTVLPGVADLRRRKDLGTLENAGIVRTSECSHKTKRKYDYAFSAWFFFNPHPPNVMKGGNAFVPILDINGVPTMSYKAATNELQFTIKKNYRDEKLDKSVSDAADAAAADAIAAAADDVSNAPETDDVVEYAVNDVGGDTNVYQNPIILNATPAATHSVVVYTIQNVPLQKWCHIFYNYDGENIDIFLNDELLVTLTDYVPNIEHGSIKSGTTGGVIGNIANVTFFDHHVTKDLISGIFMAHKDASPPI
jgi:hypothetical protein